MCASYELFGSLVYDDMSATDSILVELHALLLPKKDMYGYVHSELRPPASMADL